MGGITKTARIKGRTLDVAFTRLQKEDREDKGDDIYSGGWNNAQGVREVKKSEFDGDSNKFEPAMALCIQKPILNTNTIKTEVNRHPNKGTRVWKTMYISECVYGNDYLYRLPKPEEKLADAIASARAFVSKNPEVPLTVKIVKILQSSNVCADIRYKKSSTERDGIWEIKGTMSY
jgi:hypothetical protein